MSNQRLFDSSFKLFTRSEEIENTKGIDYLNFETIVRFMEKIV